MCARPNPRIAQPYPGKLIADVLRVAACARTAASPQHNVQCARDSVPSGKLTLQRSEGEAGLPERVVRPMELADLTVRMTANDQKLVTR